jgi:hypothetical protein
LSSSSSVDIGPFEFELPAKAPDILDSILKSFREDGKSVDAEDRRGQL